MVGETHQRKGPISVSFTHMTNLGCRPRTVSDSWPATATKLTLLSSTTSSTDLRVVGFCDGSLMDRRLLSLRVIGIEIAGRRALDIG